MNRLLQVTLLCYLCFIVLILIGFGDASDQENSAPKQFSNSSDQDNSSAGQFGEINDQEQVHPRQRRYLSFRNITHFFLRLNFKANMVRWNQIFAQAIGFRINWDEPPDSYHPYHRLYRRTVYNNLEILLDKNGLNGRHCVQRAICELASIDQPRGVYNKILKMIFRRQSSATDEWHNVTSNDCPKSISLCPFSLLDVSLYTDV